MTSISTIINTLVDDIRHSTTVMYKQGEYRATWQVNEQINQIIHAITSINALTIDDLILSQKSDTELHYLAKLVAEAIAKRPKRITLTKR